MKKKQWKEWAVEHIKATNTCPGDQPSFGLPSDAVTEDEFKVSIASRGCHKYKDCHFVEDILGLPADMQEVAVENRPIDTDGLQANVGEVLASKRLAKLRENLHIYVDRIHFKSNGALSVPQPLLDLKNYIKSSL